MSSFERFQQRAKLSNEAIATLITFLEDLKIFRRYSDREQVVAGGSRQWWEAAGSGGRQQVVVGGEVVMGGNRYGRQQVGFSGP